MNSSSDVILSVEPQGFMWTTSDPFLFCVHHDDAYPAGDEHQGPNVSLAGRTIGADFEGIDGWRMYHGSVVPGFPKHPHRGFETVTVVRRGLADHADSLGAAGRYGGGDTQWMTAGAGVQHSEMFPLVHQNKPNPLELFQIWLNLPASSKMVPPAYKMLWREMIPRIHQPDADGHAVEITVVAGALGGVVPPSPPPDSYASSEDSAVAIWTISLDPGARWTVPAAPAGVNRTLYVFEGSLEVGEREVGKVTGVRVRPDVDLPIRGGSEGAQVLMLQGRPIGEPVVQHGPFVMNSKAEIERAFYDYQRTAFGGWPWRHAGLVHDRETGRFARHADGTVDKPT